MNKEEAGLPEKRAELRHIINEGMKQTYPAYFFNRIGRGLVGMFRLREPPHWSFSALVLGLLIFLPGIVVSFATGEIYEWNEAKTLYVVFLGLAYLAPIVSHMNVVHNVLPGIRDVLVDSIESVEDLDKLQIWLDTFWSPRPWRAFMLWAGILFSGLFAIGFSFSIGKFVGAGLLIATFSVMPFFAIPLFVIVYMLTLPGQLAGYRLKLYESDPANSEVIQGLINVLNAYIYILAGYIAVATALSSVHPDIYWFVFVIILVGWIPTIMQFLINQYAMRKIILAAKWKILNRLQTQIKDLQTNALMDTPDTTIVRINQLMDLHDRISARPNSILNWGTGLSFLNQLLLNDRDDRSKARSSLPHLALFCCNLHYNLCITACRCEGSHPERSRRIARSNLLILMSHMHRVSAHVSPGDRRLLRSSQ